MNSHDSSVPSLLLRCCSVLQDGDFPPSWNAEIYVLSSASEGISPSTAVIEILNYGKKAF